MAAHRMTTMASQIIATGCPSRASVQNEKHREAERQTSASKPAPLQRLETLPPHLEPPGTKPTTIKLQKTPGSCGLRSSCINRWNPLRRSHPKSCERMTGKGNEASGRVATGKFEWWTSHSNPPDWAARFNPMSAAERSHERRFRQKSKSGEPGGVSPRILSCNHQSPGAYATQLTTSVGNVKIVDGL